MGKKSLGVYGPCQFWKQLKSTHNAITYIATSKILELLHMDFMDPMQFKGVGGENCNFICIDDFSRYTW